MLVAQRTASAKQIAASDYVITPKVSHIRWDQIRRADELIEAGYKAGNESAPAIRALIWPKSGTSG